VSEREIWLCGRGGYIYKCTDVTSQVTVADAGLVTVQNLNMIRSQGQVIVAVGASNAVAVSKNGGVTWQAVTGPAVGVDLNCVWVYSTKLWFVGTAGGALYYTKDEGATWTSIAFAGSGAGQVRDVVFSTAEVGYMAHSTATPAGRIFRTRDGGNTWKITSGYLTGSIPANDYVSRLAVCVDPNFVFGGGLGDNATDGVVVLGN